MAHTPAAAELAARLEEARTAAGNPSYRNIERAVYDRLGAHTPSSEWIRRLHQGDIDPEKADVLVVVALADFYGLKLADLSPQIAERARAHRDLLDTLHPAWSVLLADSAA